MTSIIVSELLGQGTYGFVYKIKDQDLAIKYITSNKSTGLNELGELNFLKMFNHSNILKCETFTVDSKQLGIVIPLAYGDMGKIFRKCGSVINDVVITEWFYQIISAVHFLHKNNFYHCDIKPENILFIRDKAVLSDLGLVGRKDIDTDTVCQTLTSPQLLYRRMPLLSKNIVNNDIFKLLSNEYQDDIWALGMTFYKMIPEVKQIFQHSQEDFDIFINNPKQILIDSNVPIKYMKLLQILLDPLPVNRSLNLLSLLNLELFKDKSNLIDGDMTIVENPRPVIFTPQVIINFKKCLTTFISNFRKIITSLPEKNRNTVFLIQGCDLIFRTYMFFVGGKLNIKYYTKAVEIVILKLNKNYDEYTSPNSTILSYERNIVKFTNGHLLRINISDYIEPEKYNIFINWLIKNPEKYEQCGLSKLSQIINYLT